MGRPAKAKPVSDAVRPFTPVWANDPIAVLRQEIATLRTSIVPAIQQLGVSLGDRLVHRIDTRQTEADNTRGTRLERIEKLVEGIHDGAMAAARQAAQGYLARTDYDAQRRMEGVLAAITELSEAIHNLPVPGGAPHPLIMKGLADIYRAVGETKGLLVQLPTQRTIDGIAQAFKRKKLKKSHAKKDKKAKASATPPG